MTRILALTLLAGLVGCPVPPASSQSPDVNGNGETMRAALPPPPSQNPDDYAPLCSLARGRYCHGCDDPAGCPQEDSGPLCCIKDTCVTWSGSHCSGTLGWCFNYSKQTDPASGVDEAVCHDE